MVNGYHRNTHSGFGRTCRGGSARGADVIDNEDALALKEVRVNPYVILGCMLSADMNLFTFADNLDVVEAVDGTCLGTSMSERVFAKSLETLSVAYLRPLLKSMIRRSASCASNDACLRYFCGR